jgi:hypothetical protein
MKLSGGRIKPRGSTNKSSMGYFRGGGGGVGSGWWIIGGGTWPRKDMGNWKGLPGSGRCMNVPGSSPPNVLCLPLCAFCCAWRACWALDLWLLGAGFSSGNLKPVGLTEPEDTTPGSNCDAFFWSCICFRSRSLLS